MGRSIPKGNNNRAVLSLRPMTERVTVVKCSLDSWGDPIEISRSIVPASVRIKESENKSTVIVLLHSNVNVSVADVIEHKGKAYQVVSVVNVEDMTGNVLNIKVEAR